jgi:hypothetical protein
MPNHQVGYLSSAESQRFLFILTPFASGQAQGKKLQALYE